MSEELIAELEIPGVLSIDRSVSDMPRLVIESEQCSAELYLQGAHLTKWQPKGHEPVLFLSEKSVFAPGKAIRGGIPIIFPWFGARTATPFSSRTDGPSHGFARTADWQVEAATMKGGVLFLKLSLKPNEVSRSLGYDQFRLSYELELGQELKLTLRTENLSDSAMQIEEALHTYFAVGDVRQLSLDGLCGTDYLDKTDAMKRKRQSEPVLALSGETDRPYLGSKTAVTINDPTLKRRIIVEKQNSNTTVVWNPWSALSAKMSDMSADSWTHMVCVETANALEDAVVIESGAVHTMTACISLQESKS